MPRKPSQKKPIEQYTHADKKRANNPQAGLVTSATDPDEGKKQSYEYDPHIDPSLQWAGKAERTSFEVPTQSLHVHERIDPRTIIQTVKKKNGSSEQLSLFHGEREIPLRQEIEFYRHSHDWSNRLIAGDSLLIMNSLLQKENMAGKVQCVYIDPPYGIKYGSNFQPFMNKRDVKDGKDDDLTAEPEMIKAFRDTWELGIHSYLSYMRDRLLLARDLLSENGSCFVQISDENVHHVREIMDEIFGTENFVSLIPFVKGSPLGTKLIDCRCDFIIFYAKDKQKIKYRQIFTEKNIGTESSYQYIEMADGKRRKMTKSEMQSPGSIPKDSKVFALSGMLSSGQTTSCFFDFEFEGETIKQHPTWSWSTNLSGMQKLISKNRLWKPGIKGRPSYVRYQEDFPVTTLDNLWDDTWGTNKRVYVVQTQEKVIQRCILMSTDPGDLVFDPTCGSGTTAFVAEQWGRRWITCDTSRVATTLAKQRLMTATFDYYKLAYPDEGVTSGFEYKTVPHITLKSIANDEPPATETLYDQPLKDTKRARVTGPFTVEAVPSPTVQPIDSITTEPEAADNTVARSGETLRQSEWRDELLKTGIRGKSGQRISFSRVESLPCHWLHAEAETRPDDSGSDKVSEAASAFKPQRVVVSFGPEHGPLEQRQVENAWQEARDLDPKPTIIVFAAFQFDPEADKDIDNLDPKKTGMQLLKVQMNADLQTDDLKKKRTSNESFWLIGQPEIAVERIPDGEHTGKYQVTVRGFDYFNTKTGEIDSGDEKQIALWMLDTDYDGRSLYPCQVFFPMAGKKDGWAKLAKNLKAEIDEELIEAYKGTLSLPFELGKNSRVAVKIVDDRGIESLKVMQIKPEEVT